MSSVAFCMSYSVRRLNILRSVCCRFEYCCGEHCIFRSCSQIMRFWIRTGDVVFYLCFDIHKGNASLYGPRVSSRTPVHSLCRSLVNGCDFVRALHWTAAILDIVDLYPREAHRARPRSVSLRHAGGVQIVFIGFARERTGSKIGLARTSRTSLLERDTQRSYCHKQRRRIRCEWIARRDSFDRRTRHCTYYADVRYRR